MTERAARASALTLESITELASDAIVVINDRGEIASWNSAATRMFGHEADAVLGTTIWTMMPASAHDMYVQVFEQIVRGEIELPKTPVEITAARSDGSEFPSEVSTSRFVDRRETFVVVIFRDISLAQTNRCGAARFDGAGRGRPELRDGILDHRDESRRRHHSVQPRRRAHARL